MRKCLFFLHPEKGGLCRSSFEGLSKNWSVLESTSESYRTFDCAGFLLGLIAEH